MKFDVAGEQVYLDPQAVILGGFTGRDQSATRAHLEELAAQGVRVPDQVPVFYPVSPNALTQSDQMIVIQARTSGEAEIALLVDGARIFVTLASDHTDRAVESFDIGLSKQICPKVIAESAWRFEDVRADWDSLVIRSWIQENGARIVYQEGTAGQLLAPHDLLGRVPFRTTPPPAYCLLGGTLPAIGGIRGSERFWAELVEPRRGLAIRLEYSVLTINPFE
jgi:hypothetical protein